MKKALKVIPVLIAAFVVIFFIEFYFGNNRLSLNIHLKNCNYPGEIADISINTRQQLFCYILDSESSASAEFTMDKYFLKKWLTTNDFELVSYIPKESEERLFFNDVNKVPNEILEGTSSFDFQVRHKNGERTVFHVDAEKKQLSIKVAYCDS